MQYQDNHTYEQSVGKRRGKKPSFALQITNQICRLIHSGDSRKPLD